MKKIFLFVLLFGSTLCTSARNAKGESINLKTAKKAVLNVKVDGEPKKITWYVDNYCTHPNRPKDQLINIYIPENATKESPILFYVNNAGWMANTYPSHTMVDGNEYTSENNKVGRALKEGYVVVSYGGRSRGNGATDNQYLGHSPAIIVDTKAAIRYLRHNKKILPAGDTEKIIITGTSGGGALSTVIAASGNNPDYFPYLYEIGAAGITRNADGSYTSRVGMGDNTFGVIAYCPITDLGHSCYGYEWLFGNTRKVMYLTGEMDYKYADERAIRKASDTLALRYVTYLNGLGLKDEHGNAINAGNLRDYITQLMKEEIDKSIKEFGIDKMKEDITQEIRRFNRGGDRPRQNGIPQGEAPVKAHPAAKQQTTEHRMNNGWLVFNEDGSYTYDLDKHLYYLAKYTTLKPAPSFSNVGLYGIGMNEDNLFGTREQEYAPFNAYAWDNDTIANKVGKDDTGLTWDEYMKTDEGKALALQMKMTCAMDYLLENQSDTAPYWYVRHGMDDRDNGFAVETTLFYSVRTCPKVKAHDVGFAWLKPHSGDYDVPEAYAWLDNILNK